MPSISLYFPFWPGITMSVSTRFDSQMKGGFIFSPFVAITLFASFSQDKNLFFKFQTLLKMINLNFHINQWNVSYYHPWWWIMIINNEQQNQWCSAIWYGMKAGCLSGNIDKAYLIKLELGTIVAFLFLLLLLLTATTKTSEEKERIVLWATTKTTKTAGTVRTRNQ